MFPAPHGVICARLLPFVMAANVRAVHTRGADQNSLKRFADVAHILTGNSEAMAADGVRWIQELCDELAVPALGTYGLTAAAIPTIVAHSQHSSSMQGNPIRLTTDELTEIMELAR
jgi:alcohol dehydrogenase class IV